MMEMIKSVHQLDDLINSVRSNHKETRTNAVFLRKICQDYIAQNCLYTEHHREGALFYLDEGQYYRTYYLWGMSDISCAKKDKPVIIEESMVSGHAQNPLSKGNEKLLSYGFKVYKKTSLYEAKLDSICLEENEKYIMSVLQRENLHSIFCCNEITGKQVVSLWDSLLDFADLSRKRRTFWNNNTERVGCLISESNEVVSTLWWSIDKKKRSECHHLVTREDYQRKSLASVVYKIWQNDALSKGFDRLQSWVADNNKASILFHEKMGFTRTSKETIQYIL